MKIQILKVLVLLVSISAASVLVWNASRDEGAPQNTKKAAVDPDDLFSDPESDPFGSPAKFDPNHMQKSTKSAVIISPSKPSEFFTGSSKSKITDAEIKATRDAMLSTSKSGRIMSDDRIRKMLENQKKEELKHKPKPHLIPSSKSGPAMTLDEFLEFIERQKVEPEAEAKPDTPLIHSSKALIAPIFSRRDLEKIIEGKKQDPNAEQKLPPLEEVK